MLQDNNTEGSKIWKIGEKYTQIWSRKHWYENKFLET